MELREHGGPQVVRRIDARAAQKDAERSGVRRLAIHLKPDRTYVPRKTPESRRWHLLTERGDFEILTTGSRWFDTREHRGVGSAIDLAMHLLGMSFVEAVKRLSDAPIPRPDRP
jgi:hypothetical protein